MRLELRERVKQGTFVGFWFSQRGRLLRRSLAVAVLLGALGVAFRAEDDKPSKAQAAFDQIRKETITRPRKFKAEGGRAPLADRWPPRQAETARHKGHGQNGGRHWWPRAISVTGSDTTPGTRLAQGDC